MPRLTYSLPRYRKHKASGQAVVTIAGKDRYLGRHGSKASRMLYDRLVSEWLAGGRHAAPKPDEVLSGGVRPRAPEGDGAGVDPVAC